MIRHVRHSVAEAANVKTRSELTQEVNSTNTALVETWLASMDTQTALMELAVMAFSQSVEIEALQLEVATLKGGVENG